MIAAHPTVAAAAFIAMLGVPLAGLLVRASRNADPGFVPAFVFGFLALLTFNVYDLLVLDFLVFSSLQPRWIVLPGTEGMAEYRDYGFHVSGFFKGAAFSVVGGLLVGVPGSFILAQWAVLLYGHAHRGAPYRSSTSTAHGTRESRARTAH